MTKIRKLKKKKKYQYNLNRKRINKKRQIFTESITVAKNLWDAQTLSQKKNFKKLGLVYDVNQDIKHMNGKNDILLESSHVNDTNAASTINVLEKNIESSYKKKTFRFSKDQVDNLTYWLEKYGNDFKAMSKDKKNYLQYTWKQIRYKINLFKSIPDHCNEFIRNKKVNEKYF